MQEYMKCNRYKRTLIIMKLLFKHYCRKYILLSVKLVFRAMLKVQPFYIVVLLDEGHRGYLLLV